jgi:hypothetical protein
MVVSYTLKIAIYVLKSVNGGLFYTPLYIHATFYHSGILKGCDDDYDFSPFNPENMVRTSPHVLIRSGSPENFGRDFLFI